MQPLILNFYQRVMLWHAVGTHPAPTLKDAAVYLRLIEKVRLSDQESIDSKFESTPDGRISWRLPSLNYGEKLLELENEEAAALAAVIEQMRDVRVLDWKWLIPMKEELRNGRKEAAPV